MNFKARLILMILIFIFLFAFNACSPMKRLTPDDVTVNEVEETPANSGQTIDKGNANSEADTASAPEQAMDAPLSDASSHITLIAESYIGVCEYTVDSWSLYSSWTDAGITLGELCDQSTNSEYGILLVSITQTCVSRSEWSADATEMNVNCFKPLASSTLEGSGDEDLVWLLSTGSEPSYFNLHQSIDGEYFHCPILETGETITYTLGYVLSKETYTAAEDGTLFLVYTPTGIPDSIDELSLLSVG